MWSASVSLIVNCLTDNLNRSISSVRAALNKCHVKLGAQGSVNYMYDHVCVVSFKGISEEDTLDILLETGIDINDIETEGDEVIVYGNPNDLNSIKEALLAKNPKLEFDLDEITYLPKDKVTLEGEDLDNFNRLLDMLDEVEDVNHVYHNVEL